MNRKTKKILKSWYVNFDKMNTTKETYQGYLLSQKRHPGQSITEISPSDNFIKIRSNEFLYRELYQREQKARKVENGREVVVSLPEQLTQDFSETDWYNMYMFV
jgi:hypothetical protein